MGTAILKMTPEFFTAPFRNGKHHYNYEVEEGIANEAELLNVEYKEGLVVATFNAPELPEEAEKILSAKFIQFWKNND